MAVVTTEKLLIRFQKRLQESIAVDIAVAWARSCPAINALHKFHVKGGKLRIAVGLADNVTHPDTLQELIEIGDLRIAESPKEFGGIFHPKFYCFHHGSSSTVWIGSANLTRGGFLRNNELVLEAVGDNKNSHDWFESLWSSLNSNPKNQIEAYKRNWKPNLSGRRGQLRSKAQKRSVEKLNASWSWDDFVENLRAKHEELLESNLKCPEENSADPGTVFGAYRSWIHTISVGRPIMQMQSWNNLKHWQIDVILGRNPWSALGTLKGAGKFNQMIIRNGEEERESRQDILHHVRSTTQSSIDPLEAGSRVVTAIMKHERVNIGVATRLLALARPDCYVSLNQASRMGLAQCSGLAPTTMDTNYSKLLNWIYESVWYKEPRPSNPSESEIWDYRAALVDALVYEPL